MGLSDLRIGFKILGAIGVISVVTLAGSLYAGRQIVDIADVFGSLLEREAMANVHNARAVGFLTDYARGIYAVLLETTDEGNARARADLAAVEREFRAKEGEIRALLPGHAEAVGRAYAEAFAALKICSPVAAAAASVTSTEAIMAVAVRHKAECESGLKAAQAHLAGFTDSLIRETELRSGQMNKDSHHIAMTVLGSNIFGLLLGIGVTLWIVRIGVTGPLSRLEQSMKALADGHLETEVPGAERGDEVGRMAHAVQVFKDNAIERERLEAAERTELERRQNRQQRMEALTGEFDQAIDSLLKGVGAAAGHMQETATALTANAELTLKQSTAVSAATEQASANVSVIAAASNELLASIQEIGSQVARSATISGNAAIEARNTNEKISALASAASRIGEVVGLITDIASQTNLLALNATIEAARAGEAGKGFAVVAGEVKSLANQTARATDEISAQIGAIQTETQETVAAIRRITDVIGEINEMSSAIAGAVEEQGAAMHEVVRNVEQAAAGTAEVARSIAGVAEAADGTGRMATGTQDAAATLFERNEGLRRSVEGFLHSVKAA